MKFSFAFFLEFIDSFFKVYSVIPWAVLSIIFQRNSQLLWWFLLIFLFFFYCFFFNILNYFNNPQINSACNFKILPVIILETHSATHSKVSLANPFGFFYYIFFWNSFGISAGIIITIPSENLCKLRNEFYLQFALKFH